MYSKTLILQPNKVFNKPMYSRILYTRTHMYSETLILQYPPSKVF